MNDTKPPTSRATFLREPLQPPVTLSADLAAPIFTRDATTGIRQPDPVGSALESALGAVSGQCGQLADLDAALRSDPTVTDGARALRLRQAAERVGREGARRLDGVHLQLTAAIEGLERQTATPPFDAASAFIFPEVRAGLRQMRPAQRSEAAAGALASGDRVILAAILSAPAIASGLDPAAHGMLREQAARRFYPAETARLARLQKGLAGLDMGVRAFAAFIGQAVNSPGAEAAEVAAARTATATAAINASGV